MSVPNTLINSNYTQKHIVDADKLMENFQYVLDQIGETPLKNLIVATGQPYNKLNAEQLLIAIIQLVLAGQYFTDKSDSTNSLILTPVVSSYANPFTYVDNMEFIFTPARTNTGGVTVLFDGLDETAYTKPLLDSAGNTLVAYTITAGETYCAHYSVTRDAFILGSLRGGAGGGSYSEEALALISKVVESLGITFSSASITQLARAIAEYSLLTTYRDISTTSDLNNQIYRIAPYNEEGSAATTLATPFEYYNGMTIRFNPSFSNNSTSAYIALDTLDPIPLRNMSGSSIASGDILQGIDVVVRYANGAFHIVSNRSNKLSLANGETVNNIESTLTNTSNSLPTSLAVYTAVENAKNAISSQLRTTKAYCVAYNPISSGDYITIDPDTHVVSLAAGTGMVYSDFTYEEASQGLSLDISAVTGGFKILYVQGTGLILVASSNYTESFTAPSGIGTNGEAYVYIDKNGGIHTYLYSTTVTDWVETHFVKVASGSEFAGTFTFHPVPLSGKYYAETTNIPVAGSVCSIEHDMDSICTAHLLLVCTDADIDNYYVSGDSFALSSFITSTEFLTIGLTSTHVHIQTTGILVPNSVATPTAITPAKWKLVVEITRAF